MDGPLVVEKAVRAVDGKVTWLVLDANLDPVDEVTQFALYLDGGGASTNTVRAYVPRIARFLNWCHVQGVEWSNISLPQLILYKRGLEAESTSAGWPRSGKTGERTHHRDHRVPAFLLPRRFGRVGGHRQVR